MDDRTNTIFGWVLGAGIIALGLSSLSGKIFHANNPERPETLGYVIEGVEEEGGEEGPALATLLAEGDVAAGEKVFSKCQSCHTIDAGGANGIGPNLNATMGKTIAGHAGFAYSDALKAIGGTWTWDQMDAWLKSPKAFASGTKMSFAGLGSAEDRANLMLYLNSMGSNLALPPPPAEGTEAGDEAAAEATAADGPATEPGMDAAGAVAEPSPATTAAPQTTGANEN